MRRYLLDAPILSALLLRRPVAVQLVTPWIQSREAATSILVYGEVNEYIQGRPDYEQLHAQLRQFLVEITPFFLTYPIMRRYGELRRVLRARNDLIGDVDTLIAATALERRLTIVTADEDFRRVPGLSLTVIPRGQLARRPGR
ncbi:MAG TPA: type II toxin-antitoxin system VapC family toxin [Chloroflexota bacterium]|nr:type II toxin-antitoxin system VapC family toxin [Chloroflexota bacterium]